MNYIICFCILLSGVTLSLGTPFGFNPVDMFKKATDAMAQAMGGGNGLKEMIGKMQQMMEQWDNGSVKKVEEAIEQEMQKANGEMQKAMKEAQGKFEELKSSSISPEEFKKQMEEMKGAMGGDNNPVVKAMQEAAMKMSGISQKVVAAFKEAVDKAAAEGGKNADKFKDMQKQMEEMIKNGAPLEKFTELMKSAGQFSQ